MHDYTARLPLVDLKEMNPVIGKNTTSALQNGVQWGVKLEAEGYLQQLEEEFGPLITIVTGGDAAFFGKILKREIFVNSHLVLIGLNKILNHNA